jgi:hypothetical protein
MNNQFKTKGFAKAMHPRQIKRLKSMWHALGSNLLLREVIDRGIPRDSNKGIPNTLVGVRGILMWQQFRTALRANPYVTSQQVMSFDETYDDADQPVQD